MMLPQRLKILFACFLLILCCFHCGMADDAVPVKDEPTNASNEATQVSVAAARRQAELFHTLAHATLHRVHQRLYIEDEGLPIPAAVMDLIFKDFKEEHHVELQWLVVEGQAMNVNHVAETEFEKRAVAALKAGESSLENIDNGMYRRAGPIRLANDCLKCHVPDRKSTEPRTAGLIISIPVTAK